MARTKKEYTAPKGMTLDIAEGLETSTVSRFLERAERNKETKEIVSGTDRPLTFKVPTIREGKHSAAGIKAWQKSVNDAGLNANDVLARIINNAMIEETFAAHKDADKNKATLPADFVLLPNPGKVRTTDEAEAVGKDITQLIKEGKVSNADIQAMLASLTKKK